MILTRHLKVNFPGFYRFEPTLQLLKALVILMAFASLFPYSANGQEDTTDILQDSLEISNAPKRYYPLKDLSDKWRVFDKDTERWITYREHLHQNEEHIALSFSKDQYPHTTVKVVVPQADGFFIFKRLHEVNLSYDTLMLDMDSLAKTTSSTLIKFYVVRKPYYPLPEVQILTDKINLLSETQKKELSKASYKEDSTDRNFISLIALLLLLGTAIIYALFDIRLYQTLSKTFKYDWQKDANQEKITIFKILIFGLLFTVSATFFYEYTKHIYLPITYDGLFRRMLNSGIYVAAFMVFKIGIVVLLAFLNNLKGMAGYHLTVYFNYLLIFNVILTFTAFLITVAFVDIYTFILIRNALVILFMGVSLMVIIQILRGLSNSKLYIFSYLCATEILPVLIIGKILLF
jgi:hypothetical protein